MKRNPEENLHQKTDVADIGGDVIEALEVYKVVPALWSKRNKYVEALAG